MKKQLFFLLLSVIFIKVNSQTVNFDQPFGTQSWSEDGYAWSWDNTGWDNIRTYVPHTGSGHAMTAPGYYSKLSTTTNINIQGVWLMTDTPSDFSYLRLKGFDSSGNVLYTKNLNPADYNMQYAYVTLNWTNVKSFAVDFQNTDPLMGMGSVFYDDLDYSISSLVTNNPQNKSTLKFWPNPAQNFIQISGLTNVQEFKIHNISGNIVSSGIVHNNEKIDIQKLTSGIYFIKFNNKNTIKFIKN